MRYNRGNEQVTITRAIPAHIDPDLDSRLSAAERRRIIETGLRMLEEAIISHYPDKEGAIKRYAKLVREDGPCDGCHRGSAWSLCVPCELALCDFCNKRHMERKHGMKEGNRPQVGDYYGRTE